MKKIIALILAAMMLLMCVPAMAGQGDRTVFHSDNTMERSESPRSVFVGDNCLYVNFYTSNGEIIREYPLDGGAPVDYVLYAYNDDFSLLDYYSMGDDTEAETEEESAETEQAYSDQMNTTALFSWKNNLYAIQYTYKYSESGETSIDGGYVKKVVLADGKANMEDTTDIPRLDWSNMTMDYGEWKESKSLDDVVVSGDTLIGRSWDNDGNSMVETFDLTTGFQKELEISEEASIYCTEKGILVCDTDWEEKSTTYHVKKLDLSDESEEALCELTLTDGYIYNMFADFDNNVLYYILNGEIWAAPDMNVDAAVALCDCPVSGNMSFLPDGRMLIWDYSTILIRNIDPATRGTETRMTVQDYGYGDGLEEAVFEYNNIRGDVTVVLKRGGQTSNILQAMMNRDSDVDVYTMDYNSSEFSALLNRGYLTDLSGNAAIAAEIERLYPYVKDALVKDGKIVAVPVALNGSAVTINMKAWKELGYTEEDLPKTWSQFLDWIEQLPAKLEGQKAKLVDSYFTDRDFILQTMINILYQYEVHLETTGRDFAFNTPELREILDRLVSIDYDALGLKSESDFEDGYYYDEDYDGEYVYPLLELYGRSLIEGWNSGYEPLMLSFTEGEEVYLPVEMTVAFVNPYSEHADIAAEYLALTAGKMWDSTRYSLFADMTEPKRNSYYEEQKARLEKWLEEAKQLKEKAKEEDEIQQWTERVEEYEKELKDSEENDWSISPDEIASYQQRSARMKISGYNFINDMVKDDKSADAFYEMITGYAAKTVSASKLLDEIDSKVQMMRLEGN